MDKLFSYENARQKWSQKRNLKFEMNLGNECVSRLRATDFCVKQKLIHTPADTELDREAFVTVIVASMKHSSFMRSEGFTGPHYLITRIAGILLARFPDPLAFGSGSGLQCVYTVVISLWGTPAPKFVLEPPKTVFYWILLCIRKPQAEFQKFSSTHVSPSNRFISSPQLPLLVGTKDEEYLPIWTLYFSVHVSLHFFVDDLP